MNKYESLREKLRRKILDRVDGLRRTDSETARDEMLAVVLSVFNSETDLLSFAERESLVHEILDEIFGFGPLEQLLQDFRDSPGISRRT
jgi:pilus assembly protein CpaF